MADPSDARLRRIKVAVAVALSFVAGCVDIIGYISFGHAFTAHLTGNTVHLGHGLAEADWVEASQAAALIGTFVAGSIFARAVIEAGLRCRARSIAVIGLVLEECLLAAAVFSWRHNGLSLLFLAAAMGVQTAVLTRVGSLTVHTTFVTGMLNKLAQLLSQVSFLTYDLIRGSPSARDLRNKTLADSAFILSVWVAYAMGAVIGTVSRSRWGVAGLWMPIGVVGLVALIDLAAPLAIEEERDVSER